ncbi:transcription factor AP-4 isoform X1 [Lemur catta]|uniref:transcription factor AP-4 isoform X1 n=3 Tax=Lemur catta TaxID=9447 RepID=UPI001E26C320|nr:transcription factor AP-4 isoform X1 [Lemur catta]XP_045398411.1 transcription factor AP-4 isoform X1 [Lemur catta]XP_045398412.1 transcription factor AP-4 isoform X1 [Lemur catta]
MRLLPHIWALGPSLSHAQQARRASAKPHVLKGGGGPAPAPSPTGPTFPEEPEADCVIRGEETAAQRGEWRSQGPWHWIVWLMMAVMPAKAFLVISSSDWPSASTVPSLLRLLVSKPPPPLQARSGSRMQQRILGLANIPLTPETQRDQERRIRREIANSNERRRMQSINAGFQSLKTLIPHTDGEKLSKAAILQQTAEYIFSLEQEKTRLLQQNTQLKRFIQELSGSSPKRRRAEDKDEGIGSPDIWEDEKAEDLRREMIELRQQLDKERSVRMMLEEQVRSLEAHMYPEKLKVIAQQVQLQQQQEQVRLLHQEKLEREQQHLRTQLLPPPAPTHHPTVIVPAPPPPPSHHINVVTMGPSSVINSVSTSRQNLDTIVQAIQHIEGTQEKQELEEERRRAVIVKPVRTCPEAHTSDTASDSEASDSDAMDQSREEPLGDGELP